ncbi:MAG: hypothetical protein DRG78_14435 [Epsilonproteobacteria bacterium]|nr:MAG: hypothetical protein DRG78_14435 [Campylobacterota bacterium]
MAKNSTYFYLSGFISFTLFIFFIFIILFMMLNSTVVDTYALQKDKFISVSIEIPEIVKKTKNQNVDIAPKEKLVTQKVQKVEEVDVTDLFSDVWTKKIKKEKVKPKDTKRILEIQKKIKTSKNKDKESITQKIKNLENSNQSSENRPTSTANEVNEYLAKINAIVYQNFNPPQNTEGNSVKAVIELSTIGKVIDFRILTYSSNSLLNKECDKIKSRLRRIVFPINPQNKSSKTIVILTSEE